MRNFKAFAVLLCAAGALAGCGERELKDITGPDPVARVRFFNFGVNAPGVNFYANDVKMTAVNSTTGAEATTGVAFGGVGNGGFYSSIAPGQYTVSGRIAATTDKDLPISSIPLNVAAGKAYSVFLSGPYNTTTKMSDGFVVEDALPATPDFGTVRVRFVNAIHNSAPMTLHARLNATSPEIALGGPVAYKTAGEFVSLPGGTYTVSTRVAGSATSAITRADVSLVQGRMYTVTSRGDMTITSATPAPDRRPTLDLTANF